MKNLKIDIKLISIIIYNKITNDFYFIRLKIFNMTHKSCPNGFEAEMELWLFNRGQITSFYDFNFFKLTQTMGSYMSTDENISSLFMYWKCVHYVCD